MHNVMAGSIAGVAAAVAVNVAHEIVRRILPAAPRMDIVGMRALARTRSALGLRPSEHLRAQTLAADLLANSFYYSLVFTARPDRALSAGAAGRRCRNRRCSAAAANGPRRCRS